LGSEVEVADDSQTSARDTDMAGHRPLLRAEGTGCCADLKAWVQIVAVGEGRLGTSNLLRAIHFIRSNKWDVF
jgi:hypothetical protein